MHLESSLHLRSADAGPYSPCSSHRDLPVLPGALQAHPCLRDFALLFHLLRILFLQITAVSDSLTSFKSLPNVIFTVRLSLTISFNPTTLPTHSHLPALLIYPYPDLILFFSRVFIIMYTTILIFFCHLSEVRDLCSLLPQKVPITMSVI